MKILVADDDARMRQMVKQIVAGLATEFHEAGDGGEAVALCAALRPDWVLMDFRMKQLDGLRATAEIKARFPRTHVAIVSQYDDDELRAEATRVGACAYVLKEDLHKLPGVLTGPVVNGRAAGSTAAPGGPLNPSLPAAPAGKRGRFNT